jgi:hypothetical protein
MERPREACFVRASYVAHSASEGLEALRIGKRRLRASSSPGGLLLPDRSTRLIHTLLAYWRKLLACVLTALVAKDA